MNRRTTQVIAGAIAAALGWLLLSLIVLAIVEVWRVIL